MKHNWEYKKLGQLLKTTSGVTPLKGVSDYYDHGTIPWLRSGEVCKKDIYNCEVYITEKAVEESNAKFIPINSVVIAMYGTTAGQVGIIRKEMTTNQAICSIFPSPYYLQDFLYYYLYSQKDNLVKKAYGAAQSNISQTIIKELEIPVPSMEVQEQIVAELDKINEIISDCKEAIRNLDNLAQSLFYDYFGDPITNPKGWETLKISSFTKTTSGGTPSKSHPEYYNNPTIPWLRSGEVCKMNIVDTEIYISELGMKNSSTKLIPKESVVVAMYGATAGQVGIIKREMTTNQAVCAILPNLNVNSIYLYFYLSLMKPVILKLAHGAAQSNISQDIIKSLTIPVPPLELQEKFAARIEQIEEQKKGLEATIAGMQTLLDSRMDYWFN